jgi:hypothetical protein
MIESAYLKDGGMEAVGVVSLFEGGGMEAGNRVSLPRRWRDRG